MKISATDIIREFQATYPGKNIVALPKDNPTEIICKIDPSSEHPDLNIAIAAITRSAPHYHKKATETYEVLRGELVLTVDGEQKILRRGDRQLIKPGQVHAATGNFSLVKVTSRPGWTPEDHILVGRAPTKQAS